MSVYSYAKALLDDIEAAVTGKNTDREKELRDELARVKDDAVKEAHGLLENGDQMTATTLSNGQTVPTTRRAEVEKVLGQLGADAPAGTGATVATDPVQPVMVDAPLAANPANLTVKDGTDPVKTPPVVTQIQDNGVATVVAPSAPEGDTKPATVPVFLDTSTLDEVGSNAAPEAAGAPAAPETAVPPAAPETR